jgi:hypothetical protein
MGCRAPARRQRPHQRHRIPKPNAALWVVEPLLDDSVVRAGNAAGVARERYTPLSEQPGRSVQAAGVGLRVMGCRAPARRQRPHQRHRIPKPNAALWVVEPLLDDSIVRAGTAAGVARERYTPLSEQPGRSVQAAGVGLRVMGCRAPARRQRLHRRHRIPKPNAALWVVEPPLDDSGPTSDTAFQAQRGSMGCRAPARRQRRACRRCRWRSAGALHPIVRAAWAKRAGSWSRVGSHGLSSSCSTTASCVPALPLA